MFRAMMLATALAGASTSIPPAAGRISVIGREGHPAYGQLKMRAARRSG
jgi:hypothetical protein